MSLSPGARVGSYEVLAAIGAGGMGEVYRARDTRLQRDVAIKILPDAFAHDPERLARFRREAQVLASLNHPHIAQIYGLEDADGVTALVTLVTIMAVPIVAGASFARGAAHPVARGRFEEPSDDTQFDVWGDRFLVVKTAEGAERARPEIAVVTNWFDELKRLVPVH